MENYRKRIADDLLEKKLRGIGAVLVQGPKWCGKTTTAEQHAGSILYLDDPARRQQYKYLAEINISQLLRGETPRLIDEWQMVPQLWDAIRFEVDHRDKRQGQFILTGSATPADDSLISHSGAGRFARLTMRTMSLAESGDSTGEVSLSELFAAPDTINGYSAHDLQSIAYLLCRGGWPEAIDMDGDISLGQAYDYIDAIINSDLSRVDGVERNPDLARKLMLSYSRHQGTQATLETIAADLAGNGASVSDKTISSYMTALKRIFVIDDVRAWNPNLRSKTAVRTSETRYFTDPSVAAASMGIGPDDLINDLETMGLMFETLCMRDLRVYAEAIDGQVFHYRDKNCLECDAVIHLRNGKYGLVEIKLGGDTQTEQAAKTLKELASKIDTGKMNAPSFMMVLTAVGNYAFRRKDGIYVVPIGCLGR